MTTTTRIQPLILSQLRLNPASREALRDLNSPYEMHRTLCRAAAINDSELTPFLWRLEDSEDSPVLLMQSGQELNWNALPEGYCEQGAGPQYKQLPLDRLTEGVAVRFRIRANPTVNRAPAGHEGPARGHRKRQGLWQPDEQLDWINRQGSRIGLSQINAAISSSQKLVIRKNGTRLTFCAVQFDGMAVVEDAEALIAGLRSGIGHAKSMGFGMISLGWA